jgi:hypothetical protein
MLGHNWQKSTRSGANGCVEARLNGSTIEVRDTKADGTGPVLAFTTDEWTAFIGGIKDGEFDTQA